MRVVVRNEKYAKRHLWGFPQPETFTYEGEQVPAYKWSEPGTVCLTTGDPRWPVREIHPANIISINDAVREKVAITRTRVYTVEGSKGSTYTVTIDPKGSRQCSCPGFVFRKSCKHSTMEFADA
jgi:hypothetical protein